MSVSKDECAWPRAVEILAEWTPGMRGNFDHRKYPPNIPTRAAFGPSDPSNGQATARQRESQHIPDACDLYQSEPRPCVFALCPFLPHRPQVAAMSASALPGHAFFDSFQGLRNIAKYLCDAPPKATNTRIRPIKLKRSTLLHLRFRQSSSAAQRRMDGLLRCKQNLITSGIPQ